MRRCPYLFTGLLLCWLAGSAALATPAPAGGMTLGEVAQGRLLFETTTPGRYEPAPTVATDVEIRVTGPIARASVLQTFRNPAESWREAVYAFPLPEGAAVDRLRLHVGGRVIEGQVQVREHARRTYEQARDGGRRSALVEQHRPNLFTTSVANIPPGDEIRVEITYQERVAWRDGRFGLRFPMAITPRYRPPGSTPRGPELREQATLDGGWAILPGELANRVPLQPSEPDADGAVGSVVVHVEIEAGLALDAVDSPSHALDVARGPGDLHTVAFADGQVAADRDFVLHWRPAQGAEPRAALFTGSDEHGDYGLLMLMPPYAAAAPAALPREILFVIDTSGSMGGNSLRGARAALTAAIDALAPTDRFNVIRFDDVAEALYPASREASQAHRSRALRWVGSLETRGGTEILAAVDEAFRRMPVDTGRVQQIVFITDGAVANEDAVFALIHERLGPRRLFTVGIGSAPNSHFMTEAAWFGRGTYTYVASPDAVEREMAVLLDKLEQPMLTDTGLSLDVPADALPDPLPDLYAAEPLVTVMRFDVAPMDAEVSGRLGSGTWRQQLTLQAAGPQSGIGVLWAREKVRQWMRRAARGEDPDEAAAAVTRLGLDYHLVTRYTSLVAVDVTPVRPAGSALDAQAVQGEMPAGFESRAGVTVTAPQARIALAAGATPSLLYLLAGLLLLALGVALSAWPRPRPTA